MIAASIDDFLIFNQTSSTSHSLLWESLKAYLRGQIISYSLYLNKTHKARLDDHSTAIFELDSQYALNLSPKLYKQGLNIQSEFNPLSTQDKECLLLCSCGTLYEHGDRVSRLLAHHLKCRAASCLNPQILDSSSDNFISDPPGVDDTFKSLGILGYFSRIGIACNTTSTSLFLFKNHFAASEGKLASCGRL